MNSKEREVEPQMERQLQMIEDHLGLATPAQREQLARLLEQDSELKARYQAVTATLDELDKYSVNVPDGLADRIISAVKMDNLISDQASQLADRPRRLAGGWTLPSAFREVLAAAAAIMVVVSAWLIAANYNRSQSRKILCASNLGTMGTAISSYATDYPDQLPQANIPDGFTWYDHKNRRGRRPHLFILVKRDYVQPRFLVCPTAKGTLDTVSENVGELDDFAPSMTVSYSFQNVAGDRRLARTERSLRLSRARLMAIMADRTPLLRNNTLSRRLEPLSLSPNHRGVGAGGQNVLRIEGSVTWERTPLVGVNQDNIWQAGKLCEYDGSEIPAGPTDSFLAP